MKTYKNLYSEICSFENIYWAYLKARRRKCSKVDVCTFDFQLEKNLLLIKKELEDQSYSPGAYREFRIYEPKERMISAAPYKDRVVHHALCNIIEPIFDKTFIDDSYACRKGKGTHKAIERFSKFCRKNKYVLKLDIKKYFPSIDHQILYGIIADKIRCKDTLWLIRLIIDSSNKQEEVIDYFEGDDLFTPYQRRRGIPIGNLTSQFFANIYLNGLDHFIKEDLRCKYYLRYVDDLVVLDNEKNRLHEIKEQISSYIENIRLRLHPKKCSVFPVYLGTDFLGFRIFPTHRLLRSENVKRARRRLKRLAEEYRRGEITLKEINQSIQSWIGHVSWGDTYRLRKKMFAEVFFSKASQALI